MTIDKFTIHVDASALEEPLAQLQKVIEGIGEQIGLVADSLESGIAASRLGVPDSIHMIGMLGVMTEAAQQLRRLLGANNEEPDMGRSDA